MASEQVMEGELVGGLALRESAAMIMSPQEARQQLRQLQEFVQAVMVEGVDFGKIPGAGDKPTLLKSGAEKLNEVYGYAPHVVILDKIEDWKAQPSFFNYTVRCDLVSKRTGCIVAQGVGSCNSMEVKYRYRTEKAWDGRPSGDGWEQKKTKGGKPYWQRRTINEETADLANTILKMAKKRALIDATLSATRSSELFTQDVEDIESLRSASSDSDTSGQPSGNETSTCSECHTEITSGVREFSTRKFGTALCTNCQKKRSEPAGHGDSQPEGETLATPRQMGMLASLFKSKGLSAVEEDQFLFENTGKVSKTQLTKVEASKLIEMMQSMPARESTGSSDDVFGEE